MWSLIKRFFPRESEGQSSTFGLVLDQDFHRRRGWVSACMPFLVEALCEEFKPVIISSQQQYDKCKGQLHFILSFEPGWAAPILDFDVKADCCKVIIYSDPHHKPEERQKYFDKNGFDYVLSFYSAPFFRHFKKFPENKFIHFPWFVPDVFVSSRKIMIMSGEISIYGGRKSDAYDLRNWCREQEGIINYDFSGVEFKKLSDEGYYRWLENLDAVVAAGSSNPLYDLVTPKYFEIASSGALLFGQFCEDLSLLGFNHDNSVVFTRDDFLDKVAAYRQAPENYLVMRENGRSLICARHLLSHRMTTIRELFHAS